MNEVNGQLFVAIHRDEISFLCKKKSTALIAVALDWSSRCVTAVGTHIEIIQTALPLNLGLIR
jgi:hypothetical protein